MARLLETEARLEERLRASREEAARLVADARIAADRLTAAVAAEVEAATARLTEQIVAERDRAAEAVAASARHDVARLEQVSEDRVAAVATKLARSLIAAGEPGTA